MKGLTIIIPAFNEESALDKTLEELKLFALKNKWTVIVINDGSLDNTFGIASKFDYVYTITHKINRGYGASLKTGILKAETDLIAFFDADGQHKPDDLENIWNKFDDHDMIVGERSKNSYKTANRTIGKWILSKTANFLSGRKIPDLNSGLRIVRREIILKYLNLFPDGFSFSTTSTIAFLSDKRLVEYLPITTNKRTGKSSVSQIRDGFGTIMLMLRLITLFNPLKVFIPTSLFLITVSIVYEIAWGYILSPHLKLLPGALLTFLSGVIIFFFALIMDQISQLRRSNIGR